jgi:uncharacterized membrane protein (DUF2068 family)
LRAQEPHAQLAEAQLVVARDYGFASWRALKAHVDDVTRKRVFAAARAGDIETVRRAKMILTGLLQLIVGFGLWVRARHMYTVGLRSRLYAA